MFGYSEYEFIQGAWYPVGLPVSIPNSNMKRLYYKRSIDVSDIIGFYVVYRTVKSGTDQSNPVMTKVRYGPKDSMIISLEFKQHAPHEAFWELNGSLWVKTPYRLTEISCSGFSKDSPYSHFNLEVLMETMDHVSDGIEFENTGFISSKIDPNNPIRILPYFARPKDYQMRTVMSFNVPINIGSELIISQQINSIRVNGKDYPFEVVYCNEWVNDIDPTGFIGRDIAPLPSSRIVR